MKYTPLNEQLYDYLANHGHNSDPVLAELAKETETLGPDRDDADRARAGHADVDPGTCHRGALGGRDRHLHRLQRHLHRARPAAPTAACCAATSARNGRRSRGKYWEKAGVADRIELRIAPALETLQRTPGRPPIDFAFIDADKVSYRDYYEAILSRLRPNGLIVFDNVLWMGQVLDNSSDIGRYPRAAGPERFHRQGHRVQAVMISVSDGLTIARKRAPDENSQRSWGIL